MKKTILLLFTAILFLECSSSDENTPIGDENQPASYSLFVEDNFFVPDTYGKIYISDETGVIVGEGDLANNQQTTLDLMIDPNLTYDATVLLYVITNGVEFNLLYTYENVNPGDYILPTLQGHNPNQDEITFNLTNTGGPVELFSSTRPLTLTYDPVNGGTNILNGKLASSPGNYYVSVNKPGKPLRYSWSQNLTGDTNITTDYSALPFVDGISNLQLPSNEAISVKIFGAKNADPLGLDGVRHIVQEQEYPSGATNHNMVYPIGVFDAMETMLQYQLPNSNKQVSYWSKSESLPSAISNSTLDFSVNDASFANFSATTIGDYDYFDTLFNYYNEALSLSVSHTIYGESSDQVSVSKVNLFNNIFADNPNISADMMTSAKRFGLNNYSQVTSYNQFVSAPWLYGSTLSLNEHLEQFLELFN